MDIRNVRHKGLKAFIEHDITKGLPPAYIDKIRDVVTFLLEMQSIEEIFALQKYQPHKLKGERAGVMSLSITKNWRMTFGHNPVKNELIDLDFEDYH